MSSIRCLSPFCAVVVLFGTAAVSVAAAVGTAFTYQGQLKQGGVPVDGTAAMTFQLFDAPTVGASVGSLLSFPAVSVVNGCSPRLWRPACNAIQTRFGAWCDRSENRVSEPV